MPLALAASTLPTSRAQVLLSLAKRDRRLAVGPPPLPYPVELPVLLLQDLLLVEVIQVLQEALLLLQAANPGLPGLPGFLGLRDLLLVEVIQVPPVAAKPLAHPLLRVPKDLLSAVVPVELVLRATQAVPAAMHLQRVAQKDLLAPVDRSLRSEHWPCLSLPASHIFSNYNSYLANFAPYQ